MGAAAAFEMTKPVDASEIRLTRSLGAARGEVIRLRETLGHLAKMAGIELVVYDASDLVLGLNDDEDFERCCSEISHIRQCLRLHTQNSKRSTRISHISAAPPPRIEMDDRAEGKDNDSDSDSDSNDSK
jgi:hypothetical protein